MVINSDIECVMLRVETIEIVKSTLLLLLLLLVFGVPTNALLC